jgi:Ca2+-binding RTX toxin-like protein
LSSGESDRRSDRSASASGEAVSPSIASSEATDKRRRSQDPSPAGSDPAGTSAPAKDAPPGAVRGPASQPGAGPAADRASGREVAAAAGSPDATAWAEGDKVFYVATDGARNDLTITEQGGKIVFHDPGQSIVAGADCKLRSDNNAECDKRTIVVAALGDRSDTAVDQTGVPGLLVGGPDDDTLTGGAADDGLVGCAGNDVLRGGPGSDDVLDGWLYACSGGGDDWLDGGSGDDVIVGGDGKDTVDYSSRASDTTVDLGGAAGADGGPEDGPAGSRDSVDNTIETVLFGSGNDVATDYWGESVLVGNGGDDSLYGGPDADRVVGGTGNDRLHGQDGEDRLEGQEGSDALYGGNQGDHYDGGGGVDYLSERLIMGGSGSGRDIFYVFEASSPNRDVIQDCGPESDQVIADEADTSPADSCEQLTIGP